MSRFDTEPVEGNLWRATIVDTYEGGKTITISFSAYCVGKTEDEAKGFINEYYRDSLPAVDIREPRKREMSLRKVEVPGHNIRIERILYD